MRIVIGSLVLHAVLVGTVLYVPAVRDMLNLVSVLAGADYVDEEYGRIAIGERAQIISAGDGQFRYPSGYFSKAASANIAQPELTQARAVSRPKPRPKPVVKPTPAPTPAPTPIQLAAAHPPAPAATPASAPAIPGQTASTPEEEALKKTAEVAKIERPKTINKKPFVDLLIKAKQEKDSGKLNLSGSIEMELSADLNSDGTLSNVQIIRLQGDPGLENLAKEFVQALSASRGLAFLKGAERLRLKTIANESMISATIKTEVESDARALEMSRGYSGLLLIERIRKRGRDEGVIWNNVSVSPQGNVVTVNFKLPRAAGEMLSKQLPPVKARGSTGFEACV
ncbi:MAG: hypothetical protein WKF30_16135 [Pyrinomonadaceae bacterium]